MVFLQEFLGFDLLIERMGFNLIHGRNDLVMHHQVHQPVGWEVADPDGAYPAFLVQLLHRAPRAIHIPKGLVNQEILLGESRYCYDPFHYLLTTIDLPYTGQVLEASKARPYLSLRLSLAPTLVSSVMVEADQAQPRDQANVRAISVSPLDGNLLDAVVRLTRLLDAPDDVPILRPLLTQEIIYRLLMGEQGTRLRHLAILGGYTTHIARAVVQLRKNFDQPLRIEDLARELGMSVSALHHHFKAVTALSPLQFQKRLRLQEARRLMLSEDLDAASAASRVGYQDASHFNREYKSLFGAPPMRDVQRLRQATLALPDR